MRASDLFTILFGVTSTFGITILDTDLFTKIIIIFSFTVITILLMVNKRRARYKRYYDVYPKLNEAFDIIHSITNPDIDKNDYKDDTILLQKFCLLIKEVFDTLSKGKVRVCIKILTTENNKYYLHPLVRDSYSEMQEDINKIKERKFTWLSENTCFTDIFLEERMEIQNDFYFNNTIPTTKNYSNSRIVELKKSNGYPPKFWIQWLSTDSHILGNFLSTMSWKFYKSTIVVPVFPLKTNEFGTKSIGASVFDSKRNSNLKLEAFLCIDSYKINNFNKRDIDILRGLSAGLYNAARSVNEKRISKVKSV